MGIGHRLDILGIENFCEIALSPMVKEIEAILCFAIAGKNLGHLAISFMASPYLEKNRSTAKILQASGGHISIRYMIFEIIRPSIFDNPKV